MTLSPNKIYLNSNIFKFQFKNIFIQICIELSVHLYYRIEGSSKAALGGRPLTPVEVNRQKNSPVKPKNPPQVSPPSHTNSPSVTPVNLPQDETSKGKLSVHTFECMAHLNFSSPYIYVSFWS